MSLRARILSAHPLCHLCLKADVLRPATEVDHIDGDYRNNDAANLQALCHDHHAVKTHRERGHNVREGCDASGIPLAATHSWRAGFKRIAKQ